MRTALPLLLAVLLAGCDGATPTPEGTARFGLANNDQSAPVSALTRDFDKPLVGKVVRTPGGIALRFVTPLYADTVLLNGSPVAGAVACMDQPVTGGPAPTQLCNNTAADGTVPFFMRSGTKADTFIYHVNATVNGQPIQPDSARFVQVPGPVAMNRMWTEVDNVEKGLPLGIPPVTFEDAYHNPISFEVTTGPAFVVITNAGNGTRGIQPAPGAVAGDTATITFTHEGATILRGILTLTPGQVATTWGVKFEAQ